MKISILVIWAIFASLLLCGTAYFFLLPYFNSNFDRVIWEGSDETGYMIATAPDQMEFCACFGCNVPGNISGKIVQFDQNGRVIGMASVDEPIELIAYSDDGKYIGTVDTGTRLVIWNRSLERIREMKYHGMLALAFHPDSCKGATGGDGRICYFDVHKKGRQEITFSCGAVTSLCFSRSNDLYVGDSDGNVHVIDIRNDRKLASFAAHHGGVSALRFLNNSDLISGGADATIKKWSYSEEKKKYVECDRLKLGLPVQCLEISFDDSRLAVGCDNSIELVQVSEFSIIQSLFGSTYDNIRGVSFIGNKQVLGLYKHSGIKIWTTN